MLRRALEHTCEDGMRSSLPTPCSSTVVRFSRIGRDDGQGFKGGNGVQAITYPRVRRRIEILAMLVLPYEIEASIVL